MALKEDYYGQFAAGSFWLDCPQMELIPLSPSVDTYRGAGYVRQTREGRLEYVLFAPERVGDVSSALGTKYVPGSLASEYGSYSFAARDSNGRHWTSETELVGTEGVDGKPGVVCRGPLHVLRTEGKSTTEPVDRLWLHFPQAIPLPTNAMTTTTLALGKEVLEFSGRRDTWRFARDDWQFTFRASSDSTQLELRAPAGQIPGHLDSRIEESLWFVFSRYTWWSMMTFTAHGVSRTQFRYAGKSGTRSRLQPVLSPDAPAAESDIADMLWLYLNHVKSYTEPRYHPISVLLGQVLQASATNIEAEALAIGPAVESLVKSAFTSYLSEAPDHVALVESLLAHLEAWDGFGTVKRRAQNAVRRLTGKSVETALRGLAEQRLITEEHVDAWRETRHPASHGELDSDDVLRLVKKCDRANQLFMLLVLRTIGYTGHYTDRTTRGYPRVKLT